MEDKIFDILTDLLRNDINKQQAIDKLLVLCAVGNLLKDKKIKDLLNWVKSDLAQETNVKIGKTATPYRTEKIKFLNKLLELDNL